MPGHAPGFSFALHLLMVQGFYFCQAAYQPHTSVYSGSSVVHAIIPPPRRTLYRAAQPPYYNKVYKGAPLLKINACRYSIAQTMPAAAGQCIRLASGVGVNPATIWHTPPSGGAIQQQGQRADPTAGGRRNHWRLPPYLFSGFRPITNRGQQ